MRPTNWDVSFGADFGGIGHAEIMIETGMHQSFEDGDVVCCFNRRRIRHKNSESLCHVRHAGFGPEGTRVPDSLPEQFFKHTYRYKYQRVSATEVMRTDLNDQSQELQGPDKIDVALFLARRLQHPRHAIFGSIGSEYWYGGEAQRATWGNVQLVWQEIEDRTPEREVNYLNYPQGVSDLRHYLVISANDLTDEESSALTDSLRDETDPENPVTLKKRARFIDWRSLRDVVEADVLDPAKAVDIRGIREHVHQVITQTKP